MTIAATDPPLLKRQYPHVDDIQDWRAQQSIRLLWDRVFDLEARLRAATATQGDLVSAANRHDDQLTAVGEKADAALALVQRVGGERGVPGSAGGDGEGGTGGEPTIPDYFGIVQEVLSRYDPVVPAADEEAGKSQLTRVAAWEIHEIDPNVGLFEKTYGTNVYGMSTDLVVQLSDGSYADVASAQDNGDGTFTILATWGPRVGDSNTTDAGRWIEPTTTLRDLSGPMTLLP